MQDLGNIIMGIIFSVPHLQKQRLFGLKKWGL